VNRDAFRARRANEFVHKLLRVIAALCVSSRPRDAYASIDDRRTHDKRAHDRAMQRRLERNASEMRARVMQRRFAKSGGTARPSNKPSRRGGRRAR